MSRAGAKTASLRRLKRPRHGMRWRVAWRPPATPAASFFYYRTRAVAQRLVNALLAPLPGPCPYCACPRLWNCHKERPRRKPPRKAPRRTP
jgi:hypothetical protein